MSALPQLWFEPFRPDLGLGKRVRALAAVRGEDGQALTEYALVILLIVLVAVPALELIGVSVFTYINETAGKV